MVYNWRNEEDPEWGDDPGDKRALVYLLLATICLGIGMWILWTVAAELP